MLPACVAVLLAGCLVEGPPPASTSPTGDHAVILYVSNQSFQQPDAHITVTLDGNVIFDREAPVRDEHYWQTVNLSLTKGTHRFDVRETRSGTTDTFSATLAEDHWIVIDYWTGPSRFTFNDSREPVAFD